MVKSEHIPKSSNSIPTIKPLLHLSHAFTSMHPTLSDSNLNGSKRFVNYITTPRTMKVAHSR